MKSKKSKSSSKRRDRSRSLSDDGKSKRSRKPRSKSKEKKKVTETGVSSRKSRWQEQKDADPKIVPKSAASSKEETSVPTPRIKDLLHDKEKIVDLLFSTITGKAFQELVPSYLEKRSKEELKKLCLEQLKSLPDDVILMIISGQAVSSSAEGKEVEKVEKGENIKVEKTVVPKEDIKEVTKRKTEEISVSVADTSSDTASIDVLELYTTATDESILEEESEIPLVIKDEVAKDLLTPERDAELLELEMRARAIRSLLKARSQALQDDDEDDDSEERNSDM